MKIVSQAIAALCFTACCVQAGPSTTSTAPETRSQYDVRNYGAVGNGLSLDTVAIQKAIGAAEAAGGGTVHVPAGTYLSGALALKSNVTLNLHAGAILRGSSKLEDYASHPGLIHAENAHNVAVTGHGVLEHQKKSLKSLDVWITSASRYDSPAMETRGRILNFVHCRGVRVAGVTLRNSMTWIQHYFECEDVIIDGVTVHNHGDLYNDGMDIDNCRDVRISNCRITSGDDGIVLKSRSGHFCENITITNCIVSSHSNAIKLGTESHGGFRHIVVGNCAVVPVDPSEPRRNGASTGLAGIALIVVDGGLLEQVAISNITIRGTIAPIFVRLGNRGRKWRPDMDTPPIGKLRRVSVSNVVATEASSVGCSITGLPGHRIEDLTLSDISITFGEPGEFVNYDRIEPGGIRDDVHREIPEKPDDYPECVMFGKLPAYGFYVRHVDGLTLRNVRLNWTEHDQRPAVFSEDVHNLNVDALQARSAKDAAPVIVLNDVDTALIRGCIAASDTNVFLGLQGKTTGVGLIGNNLGHSARVFDLAPGVSAGSLYEAANVIE